MGHRKASHQTARCQVSRPGRYRTSRHTWVRSSTSPRGQEVEAAPGAMHRMMGKQVQATQTVECYSALKRKEILTRGRI